MAKKANQKNKLINKNGQKSRFPTEEVRIQTPPKDTYILFVVISSIEQSLIIVLLLKIFSFQSYFWFILHFIIFKLMVFLITVVLGKKFMKFILILSWINAILDDLTIHIFICVFVFINSYYLDKIIEVSFFRGQVIYPVSIITTIICAAIFIILFGMVSKAYFMTLYFRKAFVPKKLYFFIYNTLLTAIFIYLPIIIITIYFVFKYDYIFLLIILSLFFVLFTILLPNLYLKKNYTDHVFVISIFIWFFL
ncbi:hypothetical protein TUBRATIS_22480 [Tubulinosema ratisbonensis]|uniref:Uncharacterized protein n=1 Tax=Tubulinosema ratisbonensis TaxID=291195 RepID=A0A437AJJ8_9MICR|nr:hypothetical protein TUBRATIS_22480 [Tubulinosema ratisbonensis]